MKDCFVIIFITYSNSETKISTSILLPHTHTRLTALFPGLPRRAGTRKVKPTWILLKQETVSGNSISWAIYKSAPRSRQITMPATHRCFLQASPSCHPTNSVKALKANATTTTAIKKRFHSIILLPVPPVSIMISD